MAKWAAAVLRYRPEVLDALADHGLAPDAATPPALVRTYLDAIYRYEIRRLRSRLLRREFPRPEYAGRVRQIRRRYPLLSLAIDAWTDDEGRRPGGGGGGDR